MCSAHPGSDGAGLAMLEVGAGTGRFATYVRDNYPQAEVTVSDLSPFYLQEARDTMAHWQEQRGRCAPIPPFMPAAVHIAELHAGCVCEVVQTHSALSTLRLLYLCPRRHAAQPQRQPECQSGAQRSMSPYSLTHGDRCRAAPTARFVQAAAEALPLPSDSFDVVYSVYMFHEMPDTARHAALAEMARVLKPGGTLVVTDSSQLGDRPKQDATMVNFKNLNEPHYPSFIQFDFGAAFKRLGLAPGLKVLQSATKSLSATKPLRDSN